MSIFEGDMRREALREAVTLHRGFDVVDSSEVVVTAKRFLAFLVPTADADAPDEPEATEAPEEETETETTQDVIEHIHRFVIEHPVYTPTPIRPYWQQYQVWSEASGATAAGPVSFNTALSDLGLAVNNSTVTPGEKPEALF